MQEKLMKYKYFLGIGVIVGAMLMYQWWSSPNEKKQANIFIEELATDDEQEEQGEEQLGESNCVMVDVKGAVKKKGVYELAEGQRVIDAISVAGGLTENADETQINLAELLKDEMVIYVPYVGEEGDENSVFIEKTQRESTVNINKATSEELQTIPGIGPSKAESIIQHREESGPFQKIEDITNVSGIGAKSFEKIKEKISVK